MWRRVVDVACRSVTRYTTTRGVTESAPPIIINLCHAVIVVLNGDDRRGLAVAERIRVPGLRKRPAVDVVHRICRGYFLHHYFTPV